MKVGTRIELADGQVDGFLLPERARHNIPSGEYLVDEERGSGVTMYNIDTGAKWEASAMHIKAVTAPYGDYWPLGDGRYSYRALTQTAE